MYRTLFPRRIVFTLLLLIVSFTSSILAQPLPGQWTATTLSTDAKVQALAVNGTTLLAGTSSGVWSTTDNGTTWTQVNTGLTTLDVRALAVGGTTIYAGTNGGGVFRSTDGTNWTALNTGLGHGTVYSLATNGTDVYAGTYGGGVYRLSGTTWTEVNTGLSTSAQVYSLLINGNDVYAGGLLSFTDFHRIYRSTDKGANWKATGGTDSSLSSNPSYPVYGMAVNGSTFLAATRDGMYRSTDNGTNWSLLEKLPLRVLSVLAMPEAATFYAAGLTPDGAQYGVSVSTDNGTTWRASSFGLPGANSLAAIGSNLFAGASSTGGVAISTTQPIPNNSVSAADYRGVSAHAPESIATLFGAALATGQAVAASTPLPTTLAGTTVTLKDSQGVERLAPLFYVDKTQINYQVPAGIASGWAYITVRSGDGTLSYATAHISTAAFGLFTADASGTGVPAAYLQRVRADGSQSIELIGQYDPAQNKWVTVPIDLGPESDQVFLVLFGTGIRGWNTAQKPVVGYFKLDASYYEPVVADYAGAQPEYAGLDQINLRLPRSLKGSGEITLYVTATGGPFSNTVRIRIL